MKRLTLPHWRPNIRTQLALWYTAIFAVVVLLGGTILYTVLKNSLGASLDSALQVRTQGIAAGISNDTGSIVVQDVTGELPDLGAPADGTASTPTAATADVNLGTLVRVLTPKNQPVYSSPAFRSLALPTKALSDPLHGRTWQGTIMMPDGQTVRVYSAALVDNGQVYGIIQVGQTLAPLTTTLNHLVVALLTLFPLALLVSAGGSYWLAGRAFAPIGRLTRTARAIEAGDLHRRVPVGATRDEVQELALTLNAMIARLEAAFTRQRRFIADASHELRTPVAAILSLTENALDLAEERDPILVLREVNTEALRLRHLISDLLSLARADEGQLVLDRDMVPLDLLVSDVVASLQPLAEERAITLATTALDPVQVQGDAPRLALVLMGLVDNALTYTNAGGTITLAVHLVNDTAQIAVNDTGMGIAAPDLPHIFERFYRADRARSRAAGGNGLGLAIAATIVQLHGGTITAASRVGQGSTFTLTLPGATR